MQRSEARILTTHVGSLVRPPFLRAADDGADGEPADKARRVSEAVEEIVRQQLDAGIDIVNDGEFGKSSWSAYILERISGFEVRENEMKPTDWLGRDRERFADFFAKEAPFGVTGRPVEACIGPIAYTGTDALERSIADLRTALEGKAAAEAFMTAVAPASTAYDGVNEHYASEKDYIYAIADALRVEYRAIHEAGFLVQVDDALLANFYDHLIQQGRQTYTDWAMLRVEALNHALQDIPEDRVRYHICFGSWHVPHVADAPLAEIADFMLKVKAQAYSIEAANPRHEHEWRVWQDAKLPEGKILIPGVVTHHTTTVEHPRLVADRIVRFAELVGRENVIAGTDCGFAQLQDVERVHPSVMWAKLESLVEGAAIASAELWP